MGDQDNYTIDLSDDSVNIIDLDDITLTNDNSSLWSVDYIDIDENELDCANDITISRPGKEPLKVAETLEKIMDRLAIIEPDFDKMERYPALKEAYDNYKLIEAMLPNKNNDD